MPGTAVGLSDWKLVYVTLTAQFSSQCATESLVSGDRGAGEEQVTKIVAYRCTRVPDAFASIQRRLRSVRECRAVCPAMLRENVRRGGSRCIAGEVREEFRSSRVQPWQAKGEGS